MLELNGCVIESWIDPELILSECSSLCPEVLDPDNDLTPFYAKAASFFNWITGFCWPGCCERVAEPCWESCSGCSCSHWGGPKFTPMMIGGQWRNTGCGCCSAGSCCDQQGIPLRPKPVKEVSKVIVDGVEIDPDDYRLTRTGLLVREGGMDWPDCGGIEIYFSAGAEPPEWVACAAREYARELICQCFCPSKCSLPAGWDSANFGGGLSVSKKKIASPLFGLTPSIDRVLHQFVDKNGRPRRSGRVLSPDVPAPIVGYPI